MRHEPVYQFLAPLDQKVILVLSVSHFKYWIFSLIEMRENVRNNFWKKILKPLIKDRTDKIELTEKDKLEIGELNPGWIFIILTSCPWRPQVVRLGPSESGEPVDIRQKLKFWMYSHFSWRSFCKWKQIADPWLHDSN